MRSKTERGRLKFENAREAYKEWEKQMILSEYVFPKRPSSDGYYHVYVRDPSTKNGRKQIKAKSLEKLKERVYEHEKKLNAENGNTFKKAFARVQEERLKYIKDPEKKLSAQNTVMRTQKSYERFFKGTFIEGMLVEEITKKDIETICFDNLSKYDLKKKAFLTLRGIIKSITRYAYEQYWTADDVYTRVDFKKFNNMLIRDVPIEKRIHSDDELRKIAAYIIESHEIRPNNLTSYALELQIAMGLRRGEIPPLQWTDITESYVLISKEQLTLFDENGQKYYKIVNHTKTWKDRKFPVTSKVKYIIDSIQAVHDRNGWTSKYLFPAKNANGVLSNDTVYSYYYRMCNKLNIEISNEIIRGPHSFRRNAITNTINQSGGNIILASKLYGNTPNVASNNYYAGLDMDDARAILEGNQKR